MLTNIRDIKFNKTYKKLNSVNKILNVQRTNKLAKINFSTLTPEELYDAIIQKYISLDYVGQNSSILKTRTGVFKAKYTKDMIAAIKFWERRLEERLWIKEDRFQREW